MHPRLPRLLLGAVSFLALSVAATATQFTYFGVLSGANEVPLVVSPGTGNAIVIYDSTVHTLEVIVTFSGLLGNSTASHIHAPGGPGVGAPVATQTPSFVGFPLGVTSGAYDHTFSLVDPAFYNAPFLAANGGTAAGAEAALALDLATGQAYLNVHSVTFPGGELRANLAAAVPDSSVTAWLLAPGVLALFGFARFRRILPA